MRSCDHHPHHHHRPTMKDDAKTGSPKASSVGFSKRRGEAAARRAAFTFQLPGLIWAARTTPQWSQWKGKIQSWTNTYCNLDKYKLQFRRLHFAIYAAFTFQTCPIWAAATTAEPTGHSGEGEEIQSLTIGGESSRSAQNQNCLIATTSDLTLSSPSSK